MKRIIAVLLFSLLSCGIFAQRDSLSFPKWINKSPGIILQHAGGLAFTGFGFYGAGMATVAFSTQFEDGKTIRYIGSGLILAGVAFQLAAWINIHRVGIIMEKRKIGLYSGTSGIGFRYSF